MQVYRASPKAFLGTRKWTPGKRNSHWNASFLQVYASFSGVFIAFMMNGTSKKPDPPFCLMSFKTWGDWMGIDALKWRTGEQLFQYVPIKNHGTKMKTGSNLTTCEIKTKSKAKHNMLKEFKSIPSSCDLYPIPSMYGIFTYICHENQPNVQ